MEEQDQAVKEIELIDICQIFVICAHSKVVSNWKPEIASYSS